MVHSYTAAGVEEDYRMLTDARSDKNHAQREKKAAMVFFLFIAATTFSDNFAQGLFRAHSA